MLERFINKTTFESQEDFIKNFKIKVPENFNFGYDVVDAWAEEEPDKIALCWTNDQGEHIDFTFADLKKYTDQTAAYFQSLGIGHGDMVMLILKRRYEFWFSIIALHKLGAVVIPATHLLTKKDIVYRANAARYQDDRLRGRGSDHPTYHRLAARFTLYKECCFGRSRNPRRLRGLPQRSRKRGSVRTSGTSEQ